MLALGTATVQPTRTGPRCCPRTTRQSLRVRSSQAGRFLPLSTPPHVRKERGLGWVQVRAMGEDNKGFGKKQDNGPQVQLKVCSLSPAHLDKTPFPWPQSQAATNAMRRTLLCAWNFYYRGGGVGSLRCALCRVSETPSPPGNCATQVSSRGKVASRPGQSSEKDIRKQRDMVRPRTARRTYTRRETSSPLSRRLGQCSLGPLVDACKCSLFLWSAYIVTIPAHLSLHTAVLARAPGRLLASDSSF